MTRIAQRALQRRDYDLEALEGAFRRAALDQAAQDLGQVMSTVGTAASAAPVRCPHCGGPMRNTGPRSKTVLTLAGETAYTRTRPLAVSRAGVQSTTATAPFGGNALVRLAARI